MNKLFEHLSNYIVKVADQDSDEHAELVVGKKYLVAYYDNENVIAFHLTSTFKKYKEASPGAYGDLAEGYYFNCLQPNCSYALESECYGHYAFKFFELVDTFNYSHFFDILKSKYSCDTNYTNFYNSENKDDEQDDQDDFNDNSPIYVMKAENYILCSNYLSPHIDLGFYMLNFNGSSYRFDPKNVGESNYPFMSNTFLIKIEQLVVE